jgi:hypothetical protein
MEYVDSRISGNNQCQYCDWSTSLSAIMSHEDFQPNCPIVREEQRKKEIDEYQNHFCPSCEWCADYPMSHTEWSNNIKKCVKDKK